MSVGSTRDIPSGYQCPTCFDLLDETEPVLCEGKNFHSFHEGCILPWLYNPYDEDLGAGRTRAVDPAGVRSCPVCREDISMPDGDLKLNPALQKAVEAWKCNSGMQLPPLSTLRPREWQEVPRASDPKKDDCCSLIWKVLKYIGNLLKNILYFCTCQITWQEFWQKV